MTPMYRCHTAASMTVLSRLLHRASLLSPSSAAAPISLWSWMPALHIATNSNHIYITSTIVLLSSQAERNISGWLSCGSIRLLLHAVRKERLTEEGKQRQKQMKGKKVQFLKCFGYAGMGEFKANKSLAHSFVFLSKHSSTSCTTLKVLPCLPFWQGAVVIPCPVPWSRTSRGHLPAASRARSWHCTCWLMDRRLGITFSCTFCADSFWCQVLLQDSNDQNRKRSHTEGPALVLLTQPRRQSWVVAVRCAHRNAAGAAQRGLYHVFSHRYAHRPMSSPIRNTVAFWFSDLKLFHLLEIDWLLFKININMHVNSGT